MHHSPGGLSTSWKRKGYTIEGSIRWLVGAKGNIDIQKDWKTLGVIDDFTYVTQDEFMRVEDKDGKTFILYNDLDKLEQHVKELAPEDENVTDHFIRSIRKLTRLRLKLKPPDCTAWILQYRCLCQKCCSFLADVPLPVCI